jgi:DNA-directed RNA polymerase sigma subunit (sigma70/sigma32)
MPVAVAGSLKSKKKGRTTVSRLARTEVMDGYTRYRGQIAGIGVLTSEQERAYLRTYEKARRAEAPLRAVEQQHRAAAAQALAAADVARAGGNAAEAARLDALVVASSALAEQARAAAAVHAEEATSASQPLVAHNLKFVMKEARQAYLRSHGRVSLDDLNMEGVGGLYDAMNRFRTETNPTKFLTYAVWYIQLHMNKLINDYSTPVRIPEDRKAQMAEYKRAVRSIEDEQEAEKARRVLEGTSTPTAVETIVTGTDGSVLSDETPSAPSRVRCARPSDAEDTAGGAERAIRVRRARCGSRRRR